jgi:hypothetical protein
MLKLELTDKQSAIIEAALETHRDFWEKEVKDATQSRWQEMSSEEHKWTVDVLEFLRKKMEEEDEG